MSYAGKLSKGAIHVLSYTEAAMKAFKGTPTRLVLAEDLGPLISIPSTFVWTWAYLPLVFMGKHSISADVREQIIIMSFKLPLNLEESLLT